MGNYKIIIFPIAQDDLREIVDYLNSFSKKTAIEYYDLLINGIATLVNMPEICPLAKDMHLRLHQYRILIVKSYMVFFVIKGDTVEIHRILYAKRQYKLLL